MSRPAPRPGPSRRDLTSWEDEDLAIAAQGDDAEDAAAAREELTERYQPLVLARSASMHRGRGPRHDDVISVAQVGLQKAIDDYRAARGTWFAAYAAAKVRGELMRWFRDSRYAVHVPRPLHERHMQVRRVVSDIEVAEGRTPDAGEIAELLGCSTEEVLEAHTVGGAERSRTGQLIQALADGAADRVDRVEHLDLLDALSALDDRSRTLLYRRFWDERPQREVGEELDLSQAHVSRMEQAAIQSLREELLGADA